ncbi:MAG: nickel-dependent hydrogenase large subunit [Rhodospirillales bacterium]|nr:nickel-dependent hydrogenase large subunit [Rhodospirillales bacterium]
MKMVVGPLSRVDGDLEVTLEVRDGVVSEASVTVPLYRGFEQILQGRHPADAMVVSPRICGACSLSHSVAAATALAEMGGADAPPNGRLAANLLLASEIVADHLSHFYLSFMPDFAAPAYAGRPWHRGIAERFAAIVGTAGQAADRARARLLHIVGLLGGKWPHGLAIQPGGTTKAADAGDRIRLFSILADCRRFLEDDVFGVELEQIVELDSGAALSAWQGFGRGARGDLGHFLAIADDLALEQLGKGPDRLMSFGALPNNDGWLFARGLWMGKSAPLDIDEVAEDVVSSWMAGRAESPWRGTTRPDADKARAYSWCKAPRLAGAAVEVGPLARQLIDSHPLVIDLFRSSGSNVRNRIVARMIETARLIPAMERWVNELRPREPFHRLTDRPLAGRAVGVAEGARGSLGHWLTVTDGRIANYQVISAGTWNLSPRDAAGTPGPLELALTGTPVGSGEEGPLAIQHIIRSFAPCAFCATH